jgi:hypothetical protein
MTIHRQCCDRIDTLVIHGTTVRTCVIIVRITVVALFYISLTVWILRDTISTERVFTSVITLICLVVVSIITPFRLSLSIWLLRVTVSADRHFTLVVTFV